GGKIEIGELPEQALQRELSEELGIEAEIGPLRLCTTHSYNGTGIVLMFFEVRYWKGEIKPVHHGELQWVNPEDLKQLSLPEANVKVLDQLLKVLRECLE